MSMESMRMPPMDGEVTSANVDATATTAAALVKAASAVAYMTFDNQGTTDLYIVFGRSASMGAPTVSTNCGKIPAGRACDWTIGVGVTHWRAIGSGAGGKLSYWSSSP